MENRIRELRKTQGLTLQELAGRVGTSNQQISQLETGRRRLNVDWLERLSKALGCHPLELLDDGVMAQTEQEKAMLGLFRGLSNEQKEAFLKATSALAKPGEMNEEIEEAS
jgi:transcriptional regulator with XRE-family HTH domain